MQVDTYLVAEICTHERLTMMGDSIHVCMRGSLVTSVQTTVVVSLILHRLHLLHVVSQALSGIVMYQEHPCNHE